MSDIQNTTSGPTTPKKTRLDYIDLAKGVCIILVVILHCNITLPYYIVNNLRMPLYFVLSGLFFKDYGGLFPSLVQKANKLLVPFLVFTISSELLLWYLTNIGFLRPHTPRDISTLMAGRRLLNGPMWFLLCLFVDYILFHTITRLVTDRRLQLCTVIIAGGLGWLMSIYRIQPPFYLDSALSALPYYYLGYALRHTPLLTAPRHWLPTLLAIAALPLATWISETLKHPQINFLPNKIQVDPISSALVSVIVVIAILLICKAIRRIPIISYIGRYSIVTLCIHYPLMIIIVNIQRHMHYYWDRWYSVLIILAICLILTPLFTRYAPKITAQQNLIPVPRPQSLRFAIKNRLSKTRIFQKIR